MVNANQFFISADALNAPSNNSTICVQFFSVISRWAMMKKLRSSLSPYMASMTDGNVSLPSPLLASSKMMTSASVC